MLDIRGLMRFLDINFIHRLLYLLLLCSLLPIIDMFVVLELSGVVPKYFVLAGLSLSGLLGVLLSFLVIKTVLERMHGRIKMGYYPREEFFELLGLLPAAVLLVTPGFFGDLLGLMMLMPSLRRFIGRSLAGRTEERFKELYEYLKLYEL
ncbi:MAG TPA: FxsA family protein [Sediminispirochaeta sp.]|nr:FxsA family protein [Sediminispirochaeta sp.]